MKTKEIILIASLIVLTLLITACSNSSNNVTGGVVTDDNTIKIPLSELSNKIQKFEYDTNTVTVRFFAVLARDGEIKTAFDACDVCGGYKGYYQEDDDIVCKNCGRVFSIDGLGTKNKGYGCWPSYLSHEIKDDYLIIYKDELEAGAYRFA